MIRALVDFALNNRFIVLALATLLLRAKREQALRVELEILRAGIKTDDIVSSEREQALGRAREQLQSVFGELARDSLRSNGEVFLQLARERLARQQLEASLALQAREVAIESMVQPIREALAKTETQIQSIERERIDAFATIRSQMEVLASGQNLLSRETRNLVTALRRPGSLSIIGRPPGLAQGHRRQLASAQASCSLL